MKMDDEVPRRPPTGEGVPPHEPHPPGHQAHGAPYPPSPGSASAPTGTGAALTGDERTWGLFTHVSALAGLVVPFGQVVGPLLVWMIKRDASPFVDHQGKEALNFQITMMILVAISGMLLFVGILLSILLIGIPILILAAIAMGAFYLLSLIFAIVGAVKANEGTWYRYPMSWRFIR